MFLLIDEFLSQDELRRLRAMAEQAQFTDGT